MLQDESKNESDDIDQTEADDNEQAKSSELNYKHNEDEGPQASGDDGDCDDEILKISRNPFPAVLMFHEVGYLDFDQTQSSQLYLRSFVARWYLAGLNYFRIETFRLQYQQWWC